MTTATIAPIAKAARRLAARELKRRTLTDREVVRFWQERNAEYRDIPPRLEVLDRLIDEAWDLVHRLKSRGVKWAGTTREATMTIAGTAYAAWRCHDAGRPASDADDQAAVIAAAMVAGVEMALSCREGIANLYAHDLARVIEVSDDPLDKISPMRLLARVWPEKYAGGQLRGLRAPRYYATGADVDAADWDWAFWAAAPNPLTATPAVLRRGVAAVSAAHRRALKTRRATKAKAAG